MAERIPTQVGDVLILRTEQTFSIHAVGRVSRDGQQEFRDQTDVKYVGDRAAALAEARNLLVPGRRIFLLDMDSGEWSGDFKLRYHSHSHAFPPSVCRVQLRPRLITANVVLMPVSQQANLARVKVIMREFDELTCALVAT